MIAIALLPLILAIVGLLIYALAANAKTAEIGRIMFLCGLFVLTLTLAKTVVHIG